MRNRVLTSLVGAAVLLPTYPNAAPAAGPAAAPSAPPASTFRLVVKVRGRLEQSLAGGATDPAAAALLARHRVRAVRPLYAARLRARQAGVSEAQWAARTRGRFSSRAARAPREARVPDLSGTYTLDLGNRTPSEIAAVLAALRSDPQVVYAEEDKVVGLAYVPNDPSYSTSGSWGQPYDDLWGLKRIGTTQAWDTARGDGVVVAVVDTGIDYNHPDIDDNVWINAGEIPGNGVDDDGNGYVDDRRGWDFIGPTWVTPTPDNDPMDGRGHGTHVAGTIAAEGDNGLGVVGVAWRSRVMAVQGLSDDGFGTSSTLAPAIVYAVDNGADVINASFGGEGRSQAIADAIDYAHGLGVVFVAAAGNNAKDVSLFYPANEPNAIAAAGLDPWDNRPAYSNFGSKIDVSAPSSDILSLRQQIHGFVQMTGTSMAAPHVSGVAALIVQRHPEFTSEQIRQALRTSATDLGDGGRDSNHGYGRVSASGAVLVDEALEAQILSPAPASAIRAPQVISGRAQGTGFSHYVLEFGRGAAPTTWTTVQEGATPVDRATLGTFDPSSISDGLYTLRLRVVSASGRTFADQIPIYVRSVEIQSPRTFAIPSHPAVTHTLKPGVAVDVVGRATGPSFQRYRLEWAPGRDADSGWSAAGITLTGGGTIPIESGTLGTWTPTAAVAGDYTLRAVVTNAGFESEWKTSVYLEPDLVLGWPQLVHRTQAGQHPVPVRGADGATRLVLCDRFERVFGSLCHSSAATGITGQAVLARGSNGPPLAGDVDPTPGEEIIVADAETLKIYTATLFLIRQITTAPTETFGSYNTLLADLDDDGTPEILAVARGWDPAVRWFLPTARLHVYRADGQPFSSRYPMSLESPAAPDGRLEFASVVAADLDGDRRKEVLVATISADFPMQYSLQAFNADGTPHAPWTTPTFPAGALLHPMAADLDHDGQMEIVMVETTLNGGLVRVLNRTGATRPGWPFAANATWFAIADLDRDQRDEIVILTHLGVIVVRANGTELTQLTWDFDGGSSLGSMVVADVDGDSFPEVVVSYDRTLPYSGGFFRDQRLRAMSRTGALVKEWRLFARDTQDAPSFATPAIGDFTGDGKTDLAVHLPVIGPSGFGSGTLSVLTTGATFDAAHTDWPLPSFDPQNGRSKPLPPVAPPTGIAPAADAYVRDGSSAGANFGAATTLAVKNTTATGNRRISYLRFPLAGVSGTVSAARLRLHGSRTMATAVTDSAYAVSSNTWTETGITWNNRPALGAKQGASVLVSPAAQYYEWDVTAFVRAQKLAGASAVSLAVQMDAPVNDAPDTFQSREAAANRPELVLEVAPEPPPLSGHYKILARHSGKAVVVQNASTSNGADVFQWTYGGSATNDEWLFTPIAGGWHKITARHSGKAMVVRDASTSNGGDVIQWSYTSGSPANDEWRVESLAGGDYRFVNRHSGKVLNVAGAGTTNGANVDQWSWADVPQQKFQIVAIP